MSSPSPVLAHQLEGEGEVVLLLNGGMMTWISWQPVAAHLWDRFRILSCDFRGQLFSPGEAHRELAGNVEDTVALMDELAIDRAHVLGTSFGAEVGMLLAACEPERARSVIAVTATDVATEAMIGGSQGLRRLVEDIVKEGEAGRLHDLLVEEVYSQAYVEAHRDELAARRAQIAQLPEAWFRGLEGILICTEKLDLRTQLDKIRCPTLIIATADDRVTPAERSRALADAIAGAELVEHPTSGHALIAEDPDWLARECLDFLNRITTGRQADAD